MIDLGDVHLADLNEERRRHVLVVSNRQFNKLSGRVLVAPEVVRRRAEVTDPWRVEVDGSVFAVDLVRSVAADRLLERTARATTTSMNAVRRALLEIT